VAASVPVKPAGARCVGPDDRTLADNIRFERPESNASKHTRYSAKSRQIIEILLRHLVNIQ